MEKIQYIEAQKINSLNDFPKRSGIGTLNEKSLHKQLIHYFSLPGDRFEVPYDKYFIDIERKNLLIEVQTRNIYSIKNKLVNISNKSKIELVHPLINTKKIKKMSNKGELISIRKSPKKNRIEDIFYELFRCGNILSQSNISLTIPFINYEELWTNDGKGSWRRGKWSIVGKELIGIEKIVRFEPISNLTTLLPSSLPQKFTNKDISNHLQLNSKLAQRISYTLRIGKLINLIGKSGKSNLYTKVI